VPQPRRGGPSDPVDAGDAGGAVGTMAGPGPDGPPPAGGRSRRRYDPAWDEWQRPRRWPGILISCAIVLAFIGVVVWHYRPTTPKTHAPPSIVSKQGIKNLKKTYVVTGPGIRVTSFHGTGDKPRLLFTSNGKLLVLHAQCLCTYNFDVTIANTFGVPQVPPVTGSADETLNVTLPAGTYVMSVIGSGPWQIQLLQPTGTVRVLPTEPNPFTYLSTGPSILGPFSSSNRFMYLRYFGGPTGGINVYVLNPEGVQVDTVFSSKGKLIERGAVLPNPSNPYYIEVDSSSGLWKLLVQNNAKT
jgi:hypothetical protein